VLSEGPAPSGSCSCRRNSPTARPRSPDSGGSLLIFDSSCQCQIERRAVAGREHSEAKPKSK